MKHGVVVALTALLGVGCSTADHRPDPGPPSYRTLSATRAVTGDADLRARVTYGAGKFHLVPAERGQLYSVNMVYDEHRFTPVNEYDADTHSLRVGIRSQNMGGHWDRDQQQLDVALNPSVPTRLTLELGAVEANLDLGGLSLTDISIKTGASDTKLGFDEANRVACDAFALHVGAAALVATGLGNAHCARYDIAGGVGDLTLAFDGSWAQDAKTHVQVTMGVGSVTLRLPRSVGAVVTMSKLLADFTAAGFTHQGDRYVSDNYDSASAKVDIDIKAAFGDVTIQWMDAN